MLFPLISQYMVIEPLTSPWNSNFPMIFQFTNIYHWYPLVSYHVSLMGIPMVIMIMIFPLVSIGIIYGFSHVFPIDIPIQRQAGLDSSLAAAVNSNIWQCRSWLGDEAPRPWLFMVNHGESYWLIMVYSRERLRRVLRKKAAVILHLHTFTSADLDLHTLTSADLHLHTFTTCRSTSSHPHTCRSRSSHLHICRSRDLHTFTSADLDLHTFTPAIFTPSHLQI